MDSLGDRMKEYENVSRFYLTRRTPLIIRIDGKAFHSFTKKFKKPFDEIFILAMQETTKALCEEIMNCKFAYTQSDEISLLLIDYESLETEAWFGKNLQKIVSISAALATRFFNELFMKIVTEAYLEEQKIKEEDYLIYKAQFFCAVFDARAFVLPKEEVVNYFLWRQNDATRNSVQTLARTLYSHNELQEKNNDALQEMIWQKSQNWNNLPAYQKRGTALTKNSLFVDGEKIKNSWSIDKEMPILSEDRDYVARYL